MASDRSRRTDDLRFGYTGPVAQQGRVTLDRDFNALQGMTAERIAADALDFVGPCGTPDDGFRVSLLGTSPPHFWSPPPGTPVESPPDVAGGFPDFLISPGTMYVGGQRAEFPQAAATPITYSYFDQPDWPAPMPPSLETLRSGNEIVWLELTEQEVSAVEDPDLLEVALGGPDTTQRLKLIRRVRRAAVRATDCASAWETLVEGWARAGLVFDPATMRLRPETRLKVGFTQPAGTGDPCDPVATGGYLGADNQMIRVRIDGAANGLQLIWGYDNASFLYRASAVSGDPARLTLAADPPDGYHVPQTGQLVEVLTSACILGSEPDETDPTGKGQILRVVAEGNGTLGSLAQPYGPSQGDPTSYIVLDKALPPAVANSRLPLFLRVWQAALPLPAAGGTVTLDDPSTGRSTGVTVTVSTPPKAPLDQGVFWQIAVRPATPQGVYPEDLLTAPQPPDGPRRWVCPLAVIDWRERTVADCRNPFDGLVALTRRKPGCCTVSIGPADVTAATSLQMLIDRAAAQAQTVTVCLAAGDYPLNEPLRLDRRHSGITLESCGGRATLTAVAGRTPPAFVDGLVAITNAGSVTLRRLALAALQVRLAEEQVAPIVKLATSSTPREAQALLGALSVSFGVRAVDAPRLTLDDCTVEFIEPRTEAARLQMGAAVFLQGNCAGLTVRGCAFASQLAPTYTPVNLNAAAASPETTTRFNRSVARFNQLLSDTPTSPPAHATEQADVLSSARVELILANRGVNAAAAARTLVATAGVLASWGQDGDSVLDCALGNASVSVTEFSALSFASWISADATTLRLQDNNANGGIAGFWIELPGAVKPPQPNKDTDIYYPSTTMFEEFLLLASLGQRLTPPKPASSPLAGAREQLSISVLQRPALATFLMGNRIETIAASGADGGCSAALFLSLCQGGNEPRGERVAGVSVVASANLIRSQSGLSVPAALVMMPQAQPFAITGNLILNAGEIDGDRFGPSLWLIIGESQNGTEFDAVTGNVLSGFSDLRALPRANAAARTGWSPYNAEPN